MQNPHEAQMMADITALASIENRGPATVGEAKAAEYVKSRMAGLGLNPAEEPVTVLPHFSASWVIHSALCLLFSFTAFAHPFLSAIGILIVIVSFIGDTTTLFFMIRRILPSAATKHIVGKLTPEGKADKRIVIAAHMDAGQMGFSLNPAKAEPTARFFKKNFGMQPIMLTLIFWVMLFNLLSALLYGLAGPSRFLTGCLIIGGLLNLIPVAIFIPHQFAKISPGANDNASGVSVMLELARRLKERPTVNSEVMFVGVGCEETYMQGMTRFMEEKRALFDKQRTFFLIPESCGIGRPRVITGEGVAWAHRFDPAICGAALLAAKKLGIHDVAPIVLRTGGTDATPPAVRGYAATGIICMNENDYVPHYHWMTDTPDKIDPQALKDVSDIFEETIRTIDQTF